MSFDKTINLMNVSKSQCIKPKPITSYYDDPLFELTDKSEIKSDDIVLSDT